MVDLIIGRQTSAFRVVGARHKILKFTLEFSTITRIDKVVKHRLNRFAFIESSNCNVSLRSSNLFCTTVKALHCLYYGTAKVC